MFSTQGRGSTEAEGLHVSKRRGSTGFPSNWRIDGGIIGCDLARSSVVRGSRVVCVYRKGHRHAPARLLRGLPRVNLVPVHGLGVRCRALSARLHNLGGVRDRDAAHELGVLPT